MADATSTKTEAESAVEPEWFTEARSLHAQGVEDTAIAKAVHKRVNDVRKLIKRDAEAAAAEAEAKAAADAAWEAGDDKPADPPAAGAPADAPPVSTTVTAEQAERQQRLAGDSAGDGPAEQEELFPEGSIDGDGVTLKSLIKPGMEVTHSVHMTGHEVPMPKGTGLLNPAKEGMLLVTYEVSDGGKPVPIREGQRGEKVIKGYHIKQKVRPVHLERIAGEEGVIESHFAALLEADQGRAGALLDRLIVRAGRSLNK